MKKSELPVGSVVMIGRRMAVKFDSEADEGFCWRDVASGALVDYDDVYKSSWDLVSTPAADA